MIRLLLLALIVTPANAAPRSGYDDASPPIRAMQDDDAQNPGLLWVQQGETLWSATDNPSSQSCQSCHGPPATLRGAATRYPAFEKTLSRPITLQQRIQLCRTDHQHAPALEQESDDLLALETLVATQSRGLPLAVDASGPAQPFAEHGRTLFNTRMGQLNLSCAQCHDTLAGQRLAGALIPQGHPNGYPLYRLEWQSLGSLYRRLRNCMTGTRADPYPPNAPDLVDLELYLATRANGLPMESPAVRP